MHSVLWILYIIQLFILTFLKIYIWQWRRHLREVMNIFYSINFKLLVTNVQFHIKKKMFLKWTKWVLKSTRIRSRYAYNSQLTSVYYFEFSLDKILIYIFVINSFSRFFFLLQFNSCNVSVAVSSSCDRAAKILFVCIIILSICYVCHSVNIHLSPHDIPICHIYLSICLSYIYLSVQLLFSGPN